jgi:hypothetical protein
MRRVVLALTLVVLVAQPARAEAPEPSLQVLNEAPLVLQGTEFVPLERVRVAVLTSEGVFFRWTRASRRGRFVVRFKIVVGACYRTRRAVAVGARGSRASIVLESAAQRGCADPGPS